MNRIHYSPKSQNDLDEIYNYIRYKLKSPNAAKNTIPGILDKIEQLKTNASIGPIWYIENNIDSGYRFLYYKNYVVFYRTESENIFILRILHRLQNYVAHLF